MNADKIRSLAGDFIPVSWTITPILPDYEAGHRDGESSVSADWRFALEGILPDDVEPDPQAVAAYIERLQAGGTDG